jgi:hypothetical protein
LAVFYMSDAMYQTLNLSADYCSSACFPVSGSGQVIFSKTEAQASKLTTPGSGTTTVGTPIDVTVKLALGQPLVGHTVTLETGSGTTTVRPLGEGGNAVTGATGKITFAVTDAKAESITVYALDLTTGVLITGSPLALTFNAA